jgi:hypothetical protein
VKFEGFEGFEKFEGFERFEKFEGFEACLTPHGETAARRGGNRGVVAHESV